MHTGFFGFCSILFQIAMQRSIMEDRQDHAEEEEWDIKDWERIEAERECCLHVDHFPIIPLILQLDWRWFVSH